MNHHIGGKERDAILFELGTTVALKNFVKQAQMQNNNVILIKPERAFVERVNIWVAKRFKSLVRRRRKIVIQILKKLKQEKKGLLILNVSRALLSEKVKPITKVRVGAIKLYVHQMAKQYLCE